MLLLYYNHNILLIQTAFLLFKKAFSFEGAFLHVLRNHMLQ